MTAYFIFNLVWFVIALLTAWLLLREIQRLMQVVRVAMVVVIIAFPWDHLAVASRAWDYGAPGPRMFGVPLNDSLFILSCSIISSSILLSKVMPTFKTETRSRG
jgi:lycopene cyclase domain-containing protein